jgi:hypothetical protein
MSRQCEARKRNGPVAQATGPFGFLDGAPGEIRTPDHQVRSLVLYPTELRARSRALSGELASPSTCGGVEAVSHVEALLLRARPGIPTSARKRSASNSTLGSGGVRGVRPDACEPQVRVRSNASRFARGRKSRTSRGVVPPSCSNFRTGGVRGVSPDACEPQVRVRSNASRFARGRKSRTSRGVVPPSCSNFRTGGVRGIRTLDRAFDPILP